MDCGTNGSGTVLIVDADPKCTADSLRSLVPTMAYIPSGWNATVGTYTDDLCSGMSGGGGVRGSEGEYADDIVGEGVLVYGVEDNCEGDFDFEFEMIEVSKLNRTCFDGVEVDADADADTVAEVGVET